jgi:hypothetical protein
MNIKRSLLPIATLALLPALTSCADVPQKPAPLDEAALAAVTQNAGAPTQELAREVDDLFSRDGLGETRALIVMQNGEIAAERYGEGYGPDTGRWPRLSLQS